MSAIVIGTLIGRRLAGSAEVTIDGATHTSSVYGHVRSYYPFIAHADRTPREWKFTKPANLALVEAARKEALVPIRPGEPGKQDFWTEYTIQGGTACSSKMAKRWYRSSRR